MDANSMEKEATERTVVSEFARAARIELRPDGIKSMKPPWPDVVCTLSDGSQICFELTEAVDQRLAEDVAFAVHFKEQMGTYFENMPAEGQDTLKRLFGNADLFFYFDERVSKTRLNRLFPDIFVFLLACREGASGDLGGDGLPREIKRVRVARRGSAGPGFNASGLTRAVRDATLDSLARKFDKVYTCDHAIELIVHSLTYRLLPEPFWLREAREFISSRSEQSPFRRVWFFDYSAGVIRSVYPELPDPSQFVDTHATDCIEGTAPRVC